MVITSQAVTVPKLALDASLIKPDPTAVDKAQRPELHRLLHAAITKCSPSNVQVCRAWLSRYIAHSHQRLTALGKYLVALSKSFEDANADKQRIHLVFIVHDLLHYSKYHSDVDHWVMVLTMQEQIEELFFEANKGDRAKNKKRFTRLNTLVEIWAQQELFLADHLQILRGFASGDFLPNTVQRTQGAQDTGQRTIERPYNLPPTHGDQRTPYYDLPAGNLMPHIRRGSTTPLNPTFIRPVEFPRGPVDPGLIDAVKNLLHYADDQDSASTQANRNTPFPVDALGQRLVRDETTGRLNPVQNYYGWSVPFCERERAAGRNQDRSRSRSPEPPRRQHDRPADPLSRSWRREDEGWSDQRRQYEPQRRSASPPRSRSPAARRGGSPPHSHPDSRRFRRGSQSQGRRDRQQYLGPHPSSWVGVGGQHSGGSHPPPPPFAAARPTQGPPMTRGENGMPVAHLPPPNNHRGPWPSPPSAPGRHGQGQWRGGPERRWR